MKKKLMAGILTAALAVSMAACGGKAEEASSAASEAASAASSAAGEAAEAASSAAAETAGDVDGTGVKVAMSMSGPISDGSWNYNAYMASEKMNAAGAEATYRETVPSSDLVDFVRTYAQEGYNMIILNDNTNSEEVANAAADFPDTQVYIVSGAVQTDNCHVFKFGDEYVGYMMGVIAALQTESNKIGYIGCIEMESIINGAKGYEQGAQSINPDIEVSVTYINSFDDSGAAKDAAKAMIEDGCDVVVPNADAAGIGVIEAAEETGATSVAYGSDAAFASGATTCAASVNENTSVGYYAQFVNYVNGNIPAADAEVYKYTAADGLVDAPVINEGYDWTDEELAQVEDIYAQLCSGAIKVNVD